jgi:hypothetical protein
MDYQACTIEELADFIEISPYARITQQLLYYRKMENISMVEKIIGARKIVKKRKLIKLLETM